MWPKGGDPDGDPDGDAQPKPRQGGPTESKKRPPKPGVISGDVGCLQCGYDLTGLPVDHACPECGLGYHVAAIRAISHSKADDARARLSSIVQLAQVAGFATLMSILQRKSTILNLVAMIFGALCLLAMVRRNQRNDHSVDLDLWVIGIGLLAIFAGAIPSLGLVVCAGALLIATGLWVNLPRQESISATGDAPAAWFHRRMWALGWIVLSALINVWGWTM